MADLIMIDAETHTVLLRDLYKFVDCRRHFTVFVARLSEYGLVEGVDYTSFEYENECNLQIMRDYHLTLDAAKLVVSAHKSAKGREARAYFLEYERQHKLGRVRLPTVKELAMAVIAAEDEKERLVKEAEHKAKLIEETRVLAEEFLKRLQASVA